MSKRESFVLISNSIFTVLVILSWYPSFKLHQRYRCESRLRAQQIAMQELYPLQRLQTSSSLPQYRDVVIRDPLEPPSYDDIIELDSKPLYMGTL